MQECKLKFPSHCSPMTVFLEQCDGCPELEIEVKTQTLYADANPYLEALQITCYNIDKCAHLIKRIEKGE